MSKTQPVDWLEKQYEGFVVNAAFSEDSADVIMTLLDDIRHTFGDAVYCAPRPALHITLLDWIAPLVDYDGQDKDVLYQQMYDSYDKALTDIVSAEPVFDVAFDSVKVAPTTILISGHDNGTFERIRQEYLARVELLPDTKRPPTIIHSSLARFRSAIDMQDVEAFLSTKSISITQTINQFRLVHTRQEPMLDFDVIKTYRLEAPGV